MANVARQNGATPVGTLTGAKWTDSVVPMLCADSTAIYVGDFVKSGGTAGAAGKFVYGINCEGMSTVSVHAAGNTPVGVVVGFSPLQSDPTQLYRAASQARIAYVCTDPNVIMEMSDAASGGTALAATQVGNNFDPVYAAGSTTTGRSASYIDNTDASGTSTANLRLLGLVPRPDNAMGFSARWYVMFNEHEFKTTTGV